MGGFSTFRGLIALPAPFIGGLLFDAYGFDIPMLINLGLALIDIALIYFLVKERVRPEPAGKMTLGSVIKEPPLGCDSEKC